MLYMENFNAKVMLDFDLDAILVFRMTAAKELIDSRENKEDDLVKIMEDELVAAE